MSGCVIAETKHLAAEIESQSVQQELEAGAHGRANDRVPTHVYLDRALQPFCGLCVYAREEPHGAGGRSSGRAGVAGRSASACHEADHRPRRRCQVASSETSLQGCPPVGGYLSARLRILLELLEQMRLASMQHRSGPGAHDDRVRDRPVARVADAAQERPGRHSRGGEEDVPPADEIVGRQDTVEVVTVVDQAPPAPRRCGARACPASRLRRT